MSTAAIGSTYGWKSQRESTRIDPSEVARRLILGKGYRKINVETEETRKKICKFKELKLKGVYIYTAGFYTYSIFALIFWETSCSDYGVSMSHHVATAILIILSYIFRFARVGSVVLALHDTSDVFLEIGKMSKYSGFERLASSSFILFVLTWLILRLIYYPFWILWSTILIFDLELEYHRKNRPRVNKCHLVLILVLTSFMWLWVVMLFFTILFIFENNCNHRTMAIK
ncbi:hypothetical protein MKX03_022923 [Papaver bracteatum]|nr:hypothetical protein MKX03_022923 [Papaver bracteatum]